VNTNKLVRFFEGATGLKTGTTDDAGSCLSASAERNGLSLIAVVLGAANSNERFSAARGLLEYGFANFEMKAVPAPEPEIAPIPVCGGVKREVEAVGNAPESMLIEKGRAKEITQKITVEESLFAPVAAGDKVGNVVVMADGVVVCEYELFAKDDVAKMTFSAAAKMVLQELIRMK
ncbi:MAG: D-alanyl-D-alanine carboxypeptidase, partial [Oscillospiraceae bacterium]|nr:D-alanyl-D-alanine carboxypeptidase [Oscillospiraceae bacterium]